jgi:hypothetical protein
VRGDADDDRGALSGWDDPAVVELYERGRPGWPRDLIDALPLPAGPKLDLAAGTGKLTRLLEPPVASLGNGDVTIRYRTEAWWRRRDP